MNTKRRWYELLLTNMTVILFLVTGTIQTANADYIASDPVYDDDTYESEEGPGEDIYATSDSTEGGGLSCYVFVDCDADGIEGPESTYGYAAGWADWQKDWTWNGPPGNAPGGTLDWSQNGRGNSYAYGDNALNGGSADSLADAESGVYSYGTEGSGYGSAYAWGYATDNNWGLGNYSCSADPSEDFSIGDTNYNFGIGWYSYAVEWEFETGDEESIPSGTTYVWFAGGADCDCAASANASDEADSRANSDSSASVSLSASFP